MGYVQLRSKLKELEDKRWKSRSGGGGSSRGGGGGRDRDRRYVTQSARRGRASRSILVKHVSVRVN